MISGSIVALVTPMHSDGRLDWAALERLLDLHLGAGTAAIGAVGTTGEASTLSVPEHLAVIRHCVRYLDGRLPVIAGTGSNSTREAIELTRAAADAGAAACLSVTPYYNRPPQRGLYEHHAAIARAVPIPQILYNVPARTAVDMLPETVAKLAEIDNIVAIKEATGKLDRAREIMALCGDRLALLSGDDPTAAEFMLQGGVGNVSVSANVAPRQMAELCRLAMAGDRDGALAIDAQLAALNKALFLEPNPIPVKWALSTLGLIENGLRLPLVPLDEPYHAPVRAALAGLGLLQIEVV